ncbi:hypothetical protein FACS189425_01980 [Clostridia bacterium]|nr:hypothetical protein FACS189425_01980 [Clostridia bacterium]
MKTTIDILKRYGIAWVLLTVIFVGSLTLVSCLPNKGIKANVIESVEQLIEIEPRSHMEEGRNRLDTFMDAMMGNINFFINPLEPLKSSLMADYRSSVASGMFEYRQEIIDGEPADASYGRYWHGHLIYNRPLLTFMNHNQSQVLLFILFFLLIAVVAYLLFRRLGWKFALSFLLSILCSTPLIIPMLWQYFSVFAVMLVACIVLLLKFKKHEYITKLPMFMFIVGAITSFMDLLTAPLVTYGFPLIIAFLLINKKKYNVSYFKLFLKSSIAWVAGYVVLWATKWALSDLLYHTSVIKDSISHIFAWTAKEQGWVDWNDTLKYEGEVWGYGAPAAKWWQPVAYNFQLMFGGEFSNPPFAEVQHGIITGIAAGIATVAGFWYAIKNSSAFGRIMALIALTPFAWFLIIKNHSYAHEFFTYRILSVMIFALLCAVFAAHSGKVSKRS